jgi:hypothetical protein
MAVAWSAMFLRCRRAFRFRIADLLIATALVALLITLIQSRMTLLCIVPLNLLTAALAAFLAWRSLWWLFHDANTAWPFAPHQTDANSHGLP